ncbi:MAG: adenosylcobinamide-phosphate synthase CbiB [Albidovulum sp.]|jgi:adenosylcobinamide-phosphate synthase|uniref:adenosylcobinamide-phosphate synthase CbiB n=1 Tax=Albidovulum sp. TaxID=1872424 RepID=UPI001DE4D154|nr:adenosylcobinamide-phosphate synthase CbiB [uncultured Defluviimonas sp.]MCB2126142.1 cobalamin biosynthesis protein CobD [Paracoccaceae bacterium]
MIMLVALCIDAVLGWPDRLFRAIGHPVTWIGRMIDALDRWINLEGADESARRVAGIVTVAVVVGAAAEIAWVVTWVLPAGSPGILLGGVLAWPLVAMRSLRDHIRAVADPLAAGDLVAARRAVSMIVGRDPDQLDKEGIARATIESLAENTSDGIVAPVLWGVLFGLPGIAAYKAINTLDSMIGHRTQRHRAFGWAAARIDDLANIIPARFTGLLFALVCTRPRAALATMWRDARRHRSPNAGWPEAALAGALEIRLSGPRTYHDRVADEPWLNEGAPDPQPADIERALRLFWFAILAMALGLAILAAL